jgi:chemotaxis protein MotA
MIAKHADPMLLISPAAIIIIFVGTAASLFIAFPMKDMKKFPTLMKIAFSEQKTITEKELLPQFIEWAKVVRKDGIIGLEQQLNNVEHPFLKKGFEMVLEGQDSKDIEDVLEEDLSSTEERHRGYATIFSQAGSYAPTLGVLGAVMGLIGALGNLDDIDALGASIAAAFIATMYGIFTGYVIWNPIANKLKRRTQEEISLGNFIIKGIVSIQEDASPIIVERKLAPLLPSKERNIEDTANTSTEGDQGE